MSRNGKIFLICGGILTIVVVIILAIYHITGENWVTGLSRERFVSLYADVSVVDERGFSDLLTKAERKELVSILKNADMEKHNLHYKLEHRYRFRAGKYVLGYEPEKEIIIRFGDQSYEYHLDEASGKELKRLCKKIENRYFGIEDTADADSSKYTRPKHNLPQPVEPGHIPGTAADSGKVD